MRHSAEYRLINTAVAEQRSHWWCGHHARSTVPTFIQEEPDHERARTD